MREKERRVPVLYLDLDGTVRHGYDELGRFVNTKDDVRVFDGVPDLLAAYKRAHWRIIGASNQGGIALGHVTMENVLAAMVETQIQCRHAFDKIAFCRHHPDAPDPEFAVCWCRKPRPGLAIEAALDLAAKMRGFGRDEIYPPHLALFVGDRPEDRGCADNLGVRFMDAKEWRAGAHVLEPTS